MLRCQGILDRRYSCMTDSTTNLNQETTRTLASQNRHTSTCTGYMIWCRAFPGFTNKQSARIDGYQRLDITDRRASSFLGRTYIRLLRASCHTFVQQMALTQAPAGPHAQFHVERAIGGNKWRSKNKRLSLTRLIPKGQVEAEVKASRDGCEKRVETDSKPRES